MGAMRALVLSAGSSTTNTRVPAAAPTVMTHTCGTDPSSLLSLKLR